MHKSCRKQWIVLHAGMGQRGNYAQLSLHEPIQCGGVYGKHWAYGNTLIMLRSKRSIFGLDTITKIQIATCTCCLDMTTTSQDIPSLFLSSEGSWSYSKAIMPMYIIE
eukprot:scaffold19806_cov74-Skeletonema_dohrnii-CCMP3373.AAC.4